MYDHWQGVLGAECSLLEYGDFECPYCRMAAPVIQEVGERLGERLVFAFRHFPLAGLRPFALPAALASEAAAIRGQFWPMYDRLISGDEPRLRQERPAPLRGGDRRPAGHVVWPATQFVEDRVEADFNSGVRSGVRGTPDAVRQRQAVPRDRVRRRPADGAREVRRARRKIADDAGKPNRTIREEVLAGIACCARWIMRHTLSIMPRHILVMASRRLLDPWKGLVTTRYVAVVRGRGGDAVDYGGRRRHNTHVGRPRHGRPTSAPSCSSAAPDRTTVRSRPRSSRCSSTRT